MAWRSDLPVKALNEDISKEGFRLRSRAVLHVGQLITLTMPSETIAAEVRWVDGFEAGGVFLEKCDLAVW
jgi:hypothetical protein